MGYLLRKDERVYHGSFWSCDKSFSKPFDKLDTMFSRNPEAGVQFVTDDPSIARNFSEDSIFGSKPKKYQHVILEGKVPRDLNLFDLEKDEICHPNLSAYLDNYETSTEERPCIKFSDFLKIADEPSDIYSFIDDSKYDGAFHIAVDPKGNDYNDFALFHPEEIRFDFVTIIDPKNISNSDDSKKLPFYEGKKSFMSFCRARTLDEFT